MAASVHVPVMLREVLQQLELRPGLTVVDGTVGAGGHSRRIAEQIAPGGLLIGLDRDPMMLALAAERIPDGNRHLRQASYSEIRTVLQELSLESVDRILLDLGLSSDQLADRDRGFGYAIDAPLDMRFDTRCGQPAHVLLAGRDEAELADMFARYGEERFSAAIAREIVHRRRQRPVRTTADLCDVVAAAIPARFRRDARREPATRVFQALRIAVNQELRHLQDALETELYNALVPGGRLAILTFHSLEDRLVKDAFKEEHRWQATTRKPVAPTPAEVRVNPRSRSAKLRTAVRL